MKEKYVELCFTKLNAKVSAKSSGKCDFSVKKLALFFQS